MADNNCFELRIIEPNGIFYEGESDFLEFVSSEGEMGVYREHIPLTTILAKGLVKIHHGEETKKAMVTGGFVEIQKKRVMMLAEEPEWV